MFQAWAAFAQKDTVRYMDPWYRFNPLSSRTSATPPASFWRTMYSPYDHLQIYSNRNNEKVPVYGIAIVGDTNILDGRTRRPERTRFQAILYDSVCEWNDTLDRVYHRIGVEALDTAFFDSYTRLCYFEYHYNYEQEPVAHSTSIYNPGSLVSPCFELYFDKPYLSYRDNICVGSFDYYMVDDTSKVWFLHINYIKDSASSNSFYFNFNFGGYTLPIPDETYSSYYHYNWGGIFPIVNLRCTMPRRVRETGRGGDDVSIAWQGDDETSDFQVALFQPGTSIDSVTPVDVTGPAHTFTGLTSGESYLYSVRKVCHYATSCYDTVVYSKWYPPQQLFFVSIDDVGAPRFTLSPNPASEVVGVTFAEPSEGCRMELYDAAGRQAMVQEVGRGATEATLDVSRYASGVYLLKMVSPSGAAVRKLVVR